MTASRQKEAHSETRILSQTSTSSLGIWTWSSWTLGGGMCPVPCHESRMLSLKVCSTDLLGQPLSSSLLCLLSDLHLQHQRPLHPSLPGPVGCGKLASRISSFQVKVKETLCRDEAQTRRPCVSASDGQPAATILHTLFFSTTSSVVAPCERRITMSCSQLRMVTSHVTSVDPPETSPTKAGAYVEAVSPC